MTRVGVTRVGEVRVGIREVVRGRLVVVRIGFVVRTGSSVIELSISSQDCSSHSPRQICKSLSFISQINQEKTDAIRVPQHHISKKLAFDPET